MKKFLPNTSVIFLVLLLFYYPVFSQKKYEFSVGVGIPEMINLKIKYGLRFQAGLGVGILPHLDQNPEKNLLSIAGDFYYHFPKKTEPKTLNTWYINGGLDYICILQSWGTDKSLYLIGKAGRTFNFKNNTGINLDMGAAALLWPWSINEAEINDEKRPWLPAGSISYFIKF